MVRAEGPPLPMSTPQGCAPGGTWAFSNHDHESFNGVRNVALPPAGAGAPVPGGAVVTGYQWQCVEFARRWLWDRKALLLPDVTLAAEIFFLETVIDPTVTSGAEGAATGGAAGREVRVHAVRNRTTEAPVADALIIYAPRPSNFPGHVGVITEVAMDPAAPAVGVVGRIRVCDQNRFFDVWPGPHHAAEFDLRRDGAGRFVVEDEGEPVVGWVTFPGRPNVEGSPALPRDDALRPDAGGVQHAPVQRPLPLGSEVVAKLVAPQRKRFGRAMMEFRPHWAVFPFYLARVIVIWKGYQAWHAIRGVVSGGNKLAD